MQLTKEEAIKRHRTMWKWIAEETLSKKKCVDKIDAFEHFGWRDTPDYFHHCWCCKYDNEHGNACYYCPIKWPSVSSWIMCISYYNSVQGEGLYDIWCRAVEKNDWRKAAYYAFYISMLPERKD